MENLDSLEGINNESPIIRFSMGTPMFESHDAQEKWFKEVDRSIRPELKRLAEIHRTRYWMTRGPITYHLLYK